VRAACAPRMNTWYESLVVQVVAEDAAGPVMHRRIDESWTHQVDPDSLRRQFRGNARSQTDLPVFRGGVRRAGGEAEKRVYRADVDDRTAMSAREHGSGFVLQTQKGPLQVCIENSIPFLLG